MRRQTDKRGVLAKDLSPARMQRAPPQFPCPEGICDSCFRTMLMAGVGEKQGLRIFVVAYVSEQHNGEDT